MTIVITKDKNGKVVYKYKSVNGLVFDVKDHCICYENKWMPEKYRKDLKKE